MGAILGLLRAILGLGGGHLGASWGPSGVIFGAPRAGKIVKNGCFWLCRRILVQDRYLEASCRHLGALWAHLGPISGPSWGQLEASWGHLGASWEPLGAIWGTSELQKERQPPEEVLVFAYVDALWTKIALLRHDGVILGPLLAHLGDIRWPGAPRNHSGTHGEPQEKRPAELQPTESRHLHATPH